MKVLILSCNTGEGHNAAGRAMVQQIEAEGHEAVMMDYMMLSGERASRRVGGAYVGLVRRLPGGFGLLYRLGLAWSHSPLGRSPVYWANSLMANRLAQLLEAEHFDAVLMPHLFPAEAITCLKRRGVKLPVTVSIGTDYTCIPLWEETDCDFYVIPHEDLAEEYVSRGIPREKLRPFGIPVRRDFQQPCDRAEARRRLSLPEDKQVYLVMSGSMGFGRIQAFTYALQSVMGADGHIVVICGNNQKLRRIMEREFSGHDSVQIVGYTDRVAEYMAACDVLYSKPGGLTSTEALVSGVPMVHTAPIPGCETCNLRFFTGRGMSVAAKGIVSQVKSGLRLARDHRQAEQMRQCQRQHAKPDAAARILALVREECERRA